MMSAAVGWDRSAQPGGAGSVWRAWLVGWLGAVVIGVVNGVARGALYEQRAGTVRAHHISTGALLVLLGAYMAQLDRCWPVPTRRMALHIGAIWATLTIGFEFALGRWVVGDSWTTLLQQYELWRGRLWILVPIWIALGPTLIRELHACNTERQRN